MDDERRARLEAEWDRKDHDHDQALEQQRYAPALTMEQAHDRDMATERRYREQREGLRALVEQLHVGGRSSDSLAPLVGAIGWFEDEMARIVRRWD